MPLGEPGTQNASHRIMTTSSIGRPLFIVPCPQLGPAHHAVLSHTTIGLPSPPWLFYGRVVSGLSFCAMRFPGRVPLCDGNPMAALNPSPTAPRSRSGRDAALHTWEHRPPARQ